MKRKARICIALALMISTLLSLMVSVNAATGGFDTISMTISPVSSGGSNSSNTHGKNMWYMTNSFNTGTRYVLRIDGEEVPEKYYINHLNSGNFYSGTNVLKSGKLDSSTWQSHSNISFSSEYNHVTNWRNGNVTNFGFSNKDTLMIVDAVKALATKANDTKWINKTTKVYDTNQSVKIEIRAEILIEARTAEDATYYYMTYNEIRKTGMYSGDLEQMGYIRDQRGLDAIACKLYEKDQEYALHSDGSVNCSCNYLKTGGTNLAPLLSSYSYTFIEGNDANIALDYNGQSSGKINYSTGDGFVRLNDGTSRYYGGGRNLQVNMLMPNICSVRINGKYYTPGMGTHSGMSYKSIADGMYFTPARLSAKSKWDKFYVKFPVYVRYSVSVPNFNNNTAYVFEGWDYIVSTRNVDIIENKYTVTEKYLEEGTNTVLATAKTTPNLVSGSSHTVEIKTIPGYTYSKSSPTGRKHTITSSKEIIHYYYEDNPTPPPVDVVYSKPIVTKTAKWTNADKTEAEITITVQANAEGGSSSTNTKIESADIIYLLDKSYSMGDEVNTSYTNVRNAIADKLNYYLTGKYAGAGNRIGFATFSSNVYTYGKVGVVRYDGKDGRTRTCYNIPNGSALDSTTALNYSQAKNRIFSNFNERAKASNPATYTARFYTTPNDITNVVNGLKNHKDGENTNFDLPLFYAQWLLENRDDQSRKSYIIFVTEGQPYPNTDSERASQAKKYPEYRNSDYLSNKFYAQISKDLRNTYGAEIYAIILDRDKDSSSMWQTICGDASHVFYTPDTQANAINAIGKIHEQIALKMEEETVVQYASTAPMNLTDMINTDYFEVVSTNACTVNTGATNVVNNKVYWDLGTVTYGKKCSDGQWPTLKIKIRLKDENTVGSLNTNYNKPNDDQCILTYPDGKVTKPTPWLDRDLQKFTITERWVDRATMTDIVTSKITQGSKNSTYTVDRKDLTSLDYRYNSSVPTESVITITGDITIIHYYDKVPMYNVVEKYVDVLTGKEIAPQNQFRIEQGHTYQPVVKTITGYKHNYSTPSGKLLIINNNTEIVHYYDKIYTVTIKYIDDENSTTVKQAVIDTSVIENIERNTTWPSEGGLADYAIDREDGIDYVAFHFGQKYAGYYLVDNNIKINGRTYTLAKLPEGLYMDGDKEIEFHFKRREAELIIRNYLATKVGDGDATIEMKAKWDSKSTPKTNAIKVEVSETEKREKWLDNQTKGKEYLGYNVTYSNFIKPDIYEAIPENLKKEDTAKYKIGLQEDDNDEKYYPRYAIIDFFYMEQKYTLTVKYVDIETGANIQDDETKITLNGETKDLGTTYEFEYASGTVVTPTGIPAEITLPSGARYKLQGREDGKPDSEPVTMDDNKKLIYEYKLDTIPVTIRYIDKISGDDIKEHEKPFTVNPGESIAYELTLDNEISSVYKFVERNDGKNRTADVGKVEIGGMTEYIFYYVQTEDDEDNPGDDDRGQPVVSYPKASAKDDRKTSDEIPAVLLGEKFTIEIPNRGTHTQMEDEYNQEEPDGGWNFVNAQVEYLRCGCEVYYGEELYQANELIPIAKRHDIEAGDIEVELFIPEWVKEGRYTISAIVSSKEEGVNTVYEEDQQYNKIYRENAAEGKTHIEVVGKVYDFSITNLVEDKYWAGTLFDPDIDGINYKANLNSTDPKIGVLPIGQGPNGGNTDKQQAQKYNHGIALGSTFFFNVNTLGVRNKLISIKPTFKYVSAEPGETMVQDVDLYIDVNGKYQKLNGTEGQVIKTQLNNDHKKKNTNLGLELLHTFGRGIEGFEAINPNASYDLVKGGRLCITTQFRRDFIDYIADDDVTKPYEKYKDPVTKKEYTDEYSKVLQSAAHWYGEYRLPSSTKVMEKGTTPENGKEYKNGFIIVLFEIVTQDDVNSEKHEDNQYLVYNKQFVGDQWYNEGGAKTAQTMTLTMPRLMGVGTKNVNLTVENGIYPVAIYDIAVRANGQYEAAGTH